MSIDKICGIYKITSPSKKIYIGQSMDCLRRKNDYSRLNSKWQPKLYQSILKYGWINHTFEIIHICEYSQLNTLEIYYIGLFRSFDSFFGLNLKEGGGKGKYSEESKKRMAFSQTGKKCTEETKKKMSLAQTGRKHSPETILKCRLSKIGHSVSIETREKLANANRGNKYSIGRKLSEEAKTKISKIHKGKIYKGSEKQKNMCRIILNTQTGIFYLGIREAAASIGMNHHSLGSRLRGRIFNDTNFIYT